MTNVEAIETLRANYPDACYSQLREAVDVAIQALKAQDAAEDNEIKGIDVCVHCLDAIRELSVKNKKEGEESK